MSEFVQLTVAGLTLGAVYALIALGYSMVYGILKLLNFAHGDVFTVGAYVGYFIYTGFGAPLSPSVPTAVMLLVMLIAAMLGCGLLGIGIERVGYRPLRNAPRIAPLITALGFSFLIQNSLLLMFGAQFRSFDTFALRNGQLFSSGIHTSVLNVSLIRLLIMASALVLMGALTYWVRFTRLGKASRAVSYDREAAEMMGINVDRVIAGVFFIGSALAGAAGIMFGLIFQNIFQYMGFVVGLKGFAAAVIGGIGSIPGAMLGGLCLGLAESYTDGYLPQGSSFQDFYVFVILIVIMLLRPSGLLGKADIRRA